MRTLYHLLMILFTAIYLGMVIMAAISMFGIIAIPLAIALSFAIPLFALYLMFVGYFWPTVILIGLAYLFMKLGEK